MISNDRPMILLSHDDCVLDRADGKGISHALQSHYTGLN